MTPIYQDNWTTLFNLDCREALKALPSESVNCVVTSPPYWGLRDYGVDNQFGLEPSPELYVEQLTAVFREIKRVLKNDGTLWLNLGDTMWGGKGQNGRQDPNIVTRIAEGRTLQRAQTRLNSSLAPHDGKHPFIKPKDLVGIPWMAAFALRSDGWYLRSDIIWSKPNPMPESVTDRPTKAHEYVFLLSKSQTYYYNADAIMEPFTGTERKTGNQVKSDSYLKASGDIHRGLQVAQPNPNGRNKRSVWTVATKPYPESHFAVFPPELIKPCILAGCPVGGTVLDPFAGSGTTLQVAMEQGCKSIGIELNADYCKLITKRMRQPMMNFAEAI